MPKLLLELGAKVKTDGTAWVSSKRIKGKVKKVDVDATIRKNNLGHPITDKELNEVVDALIPIFLPKINQKLNKGIPLPTIQHVTFYGYKLELVNNHIQVAFDVKV